MKIVLFEDGAAGREERILGEEPLGELEELLGGAVELLYLDERMKLAVRTDGEENRLPIRYGLHRLGRAVEPIAGDCAVVGMDREGRLRDMKAGDVFRANGYVWAVNGEGTE